MIIIIFLLSIISSTRSPGKPQRKRNPIPNNLYIHKNGKRKKNLWVSASDV